MAAAAASSSTPAAVREMQRDLESQANALSKIQKGTLETPPSPPLPSHISKNHQVRKQYTIQELELVNDEANVYKLIGPVLVKQDLAEAKANVKKRIEYISAELKRMDRALKDLEEKQNSKKESVS
uniref:Prefoldin subunit 6 n=1 Tax=Oryza nivara TaxID=4536 RepID=A0A0E0G490_ORYNI